MNNYSDIKDDIGYNVMRANKYTDYVIPYVENTDPRLVRYMRSVYFFNKLKLTPCTPSLKDQFWVQRDDNHQLNRYLSKYGKQCVASRSCLAKQQQQQQQQANAPIYYNLEFDQ